MKLDDNYHMTNDANQWVLHYEKVGEINPETKKPKISKDQWYCSNLKQCLNRYLDQSIKHAVNIQELKGLTVASMYRIEQLINELNK